MAMAKNPVVFALATGMGLLTDKYELAVTSFIDELSDFEASEFMKEFVHAAMYAGAVFGMLTFGPLSDVFGRRVCMIGTSLLCLIGAVGSALAPSETFLVVCRIVTGIGMGGEYPLAASHCAENAQDSNNGGRNVGLLYLFGSGLGQLLCPVVVYILLCTGLPDDAVWRGAFWVGAAFAALGLVLRILTTVDSDKFKKAHKKREQSSVSTVRALQPFAMPLLGTALSWFLYDVIEYGLKQNDTAIFHANSASIKDSVVTVALSRLLVIPAMAIAAFLPSYMQMKWMQLLGFAGCAVTNLFLAIFYVDIHKEYVILFNTLYIIQLAFQSLPGVTTMGIPAVIFPAAFKGTCLGISAATGKVGATVGSYAFAKLKNDGHISWIFWTVTCTALLAALTTVALIPRWDGSTLDLMEKAARAGDSKGAVGILYAGPTKSTPKAADLESEEAETSEESTNEGSLSGNSNRESE